jgi:hypothetical protein
MDIRLAWGGWILGGAVETAADRLRFAVAFAEENLGHYRDSDWRKLRSDLAAFLDGVDEKRALGSVAIRALEPPLPLDYSPADLRALQLEVKELLRGIAPTKEEDDAGGRMITIKQDWMPMLVRKHLVIMASAPVRDSFLFLVVLLLGLHGLDNVRRCPECSKLFWRVRRQLYCTRTCVNRVNMRAWTRKHRKATHASRRKKKGGRKA